MSVNLGTAYAQLTLDSSGFASGMATAKSDLNKFQGSLTGMSSSLKTIGGDMAKTGAMLTASVTTPLIGLGTAAVKTTANFDTSMSRVQALTGATAEDFDTLRQYAIKMGDQTAFSASQAADAMGYMGLAGWKTQQMIEGLPGILDLAASSQMDLATASDMVTDFLTAFGLEARDATKMANEMAYAQANSNTSTLQLGEAFGNCAANMHTAGQTMETTTAILEAMANSGTKGSEAGTALAATIRDLTQKMDSYNKAEDIAKAQSSGLVSITGDLNDLLGRNAIQIGNVLIPVSELNGDFRNLIDIMKDVETATDGMGSSQKSAALMNTFTARSIKAVNEVLNQGVDEVKGYEQALYDVDGAASDMADTMLGNLNGQLTLLKSKIETLFIQIGDLLLPVISQFVDILSKVIQWLSSLDEEQKKQLIRIAEVVAAIGPVLTAMGTFLIMLGTVIGRIQKFLPLVASIASKMTAAASSTEGLIAVFGKLAGTAGWIGAIIAAVVALTVALVKLYQKGGEFTNSVNSLVEDIKADFESLKQKAVETFEELKSKVTPLLEFLKNNFDIDEIDSKMSELVESLRTLWSSLKELLAPLSELNLVGLKVILGVLITLIIGVANSIIQSLVPVINTIIDSLNIFTDVINIIRGLFQGLITGDFTLLKESVSKLFSDIIALLKDTVMIFVGSITGLFEGIWQSLQQFAGNVIESVKTFLTNLFGIVKEILSNFPYYAGYIIGLIVQKISELPGKVWNFLKQTYEKIKQFKKDSTDKAKEMGKEFVKSIIDFVKNLPANFYNWVKQLPQKVASLNQNMKDGGKKLIENLLSGMKTAWEIVVGWFEDVKKQVGDFVKGIIDGMNDAKKASSGATAGTTTNGSHADGLEYVPYNGYKAQLHEGEKVLTKNEADAYRNGDTPKYTFNYYSPEAIDPYTANKLFKQSVRDLEEGIA